MSLKWNRTLSKLWKIRMEMDVKWMVVQIWLCLKKKLRTTVKLRDSPKWQLFQLHAVLWWI